MNPETTTPIRIATILGTSRPGSYTGKALALAIDELTKTPGVEVTALDPTELALPFPGQGGEYPDRDKLQASIRAAAGVLVATPEYHGGFAAMLKLVIENLGFPSVLEGKPVALLGVAGGRIGAVKSLEQLRGVASHTGAVVLPGTVSVASVQRVFDKQGRCLDAETDKRIRGLGQSLLEYLQHQPSGRLCLERAVREPSAEEA